MEGLFTFNRVFFPHFVLIFLCFVFSTSPSVSNSRFSTPGGRSLPLTPPGVVDKPSVTISCPDGLAHALSEQNLRLQQIVYEHKVRNFDYFLVSLRNWSIHQTLELMKVTQTKPSSFFILSPKLWIPQQHYPR